jgi:hypothetical protein
MGCVSPSAPGDMVLAPQRATLRTMAPCLHWHRNALFVVAIAAKAQLNNSLLGSPSLHQEDQSRKAIPAASQGVLCRLTPGRSLSEDAFGSRKFPGNPSASLPCSQTPVGLPRQAFAACRCGPRPWENEGTGDEEIFEAQSHGFDARCLRFVPPSLTTTQNSLPVVANLSGPGLLTR